MFDGKMKAVTFSFDDGVIEDIKVMDIFNKYGLKGTFNINSECLGVSGEIANKEGIVIPHIRVKKEDLKSVYQGHEVAAHTLTHENLRMLDDDNEVIRQVEQDRLNLSEILGYEVVGLAYASASPNNDERVARLVKENTNIKYARDTYRTGTFDIWEDKYRFRGTAYHTEFEKLYELADEFIALKPDAPKLFYIWGHSYELSYYPDLFKKFEDFCKYISGKDDIFYGTNKEVLVD